MLYNIFTILKTIGDETMKFINTFTQIIEQLLALIAAKELIDLIPKKFQYRKPLAIVIIVIAFVCGIFIIINEVSNINVNITTDELTEFDNEPESEVELIDDNYEEVIKDHRDDNYYNDLAASRCLYKNNKIIMSIISTSFFITALIAIHKSINFKKLKATLILLFAAYNIVALFIIMPIEIPECEVIRIPKYDLVNNTTLVNGDDGYKLKINRTSIKTADIITINYNGKKITKCMFKGTYTYFMILYSIIIIGFYLKNKQSFQVFNSPYPKLQ